MEPDEFPPVEEPTPQTVGPLLESFRPRLLRMLHLRLHPKLRRRVEPDDVLQEAFAEVVARLGEFRAGRLSFYLWVRLIAAQKVAQLHDHHLGAARRDAAREVTPRSAPGASTASLARLFAHPGPTPAQGAARREVLARVRAALDELEEADREVLALRYFERLSVGEVAAVLGMTASGVLKRQLRALANLKRRLPGAEDLPTPP